MIRALECLLLFVALPLLAAFIDARFIAFGLLWGVAFVAGWWLWRTSGAFWKAQPDDGIAIKRALISVALVLPVLLALTLWLAPDRLFSFPQRDPERWLIVMCLYPFLSALPQEILYRGFFFARYRDLFPKDWQMIAASALAFMMAHVIFMNPVALVLSLIGGAVFAFSYARNGSLRAVVLEHALYGNAIFTLGLGWYFYLGAR